MNTILLALAISCPKTKMENRTPYPWNDNDQQMLASAKAHCPKHYKRSPCLKLFRKRGENDYSAICGAPTERKYL